MAPLALLPARATVHLQGLPAGASALVDPTDPYIGALLEAEWLVPLEPTDRPHRDDEA